jgi:hypothetical protein
MAERLDSSDNAAGKRSVLKGLSFISSPSSGDANTSVVDVKDGRILRLRPLHLDWRYDRNDFNPWRMEAHGQVLEPAFKSLAPPYDSRLQGAGVFPQRSPLQISSSAVGPVKLLIRGSES